MPYNKKDAEEFLKKVLDKLDSSSKKYTDNTYILNDIFREIDEEEIDLIGWPLLAILRFREVMQGKLVKIEDIYWDNFFKRQTDEFLEGLYSRVKQELGKRGFFDKE